MSTDPVVRRRWMIRAAQWGLLAVMIGWLTRSGVLDLRQLARIVDQPRFLLLHVATWALGSVTLGAVRWSVFLRGAGIHLPFHRAIALQALAVFSNAALPGGVAGDVLKALAVARTVPGVKAATALGCGLGERFVGLTALLTVGLWGVGLHWQTVMVSPLLRLMAFTLAGGWVACISGGAVGVVLARMEDSSSPSNASPGVLARVRETLLALGVFLRRPRVLVATLAASILIQLLAVTLYTTATELVVGRSVELSRIASVFSAGILTTVFPLTPGGLGVGHAAFELLHRELGLGQGANAFNLFYVGQLTCSLVGGIFYVREVARAKG